MSKKYFFIFVIAISFISGCSIKNGQNGGGNSAGSNAGQNQEKNRENNQNQTQKWQENFDEASSTALVLGEKIMVMGSENSDGSIMAERIIIGASGDSFGMPDFGMRQPDNNADSSSQPQEGARQWTGNSARPDFQNMSEEERTVLREEMRARMESGEGGFNGAQAGLPPASAGGAQAGERIRARTGAQMARLAGEILANDEASITLKLDGGGSKLIFLSSSTAIMKPKEK